MPGSSAEFKPLHRLWRRLPPGARRLWLARLSSALAPAPDSVAPRTCDGIIVAGEIARASGLGESARIMLRALEVLQVSTWPMQAALPVPGETLDPTTAPPTTALMSPSHAAALVLHVNAPVLGGALLRLPRRLPRGRRVIGYWAWELQSVPPSWRPARRLVHEVWVPSRFTAQAIEPLLPGRVRVVPHALALAPPRPARMDRAAFGLPDDAVLVLVSFSLASAFERKNPMAAITAFRKAFGNRSDRILLLKVGNGGHYTQDMRRLREATDGAPNIHLETRMLSAAETHALTRMADIVLSLHRSEGFGLVPAEAMMLGRAVMATDWSATAEFLDDRCGAPVGYRLVPARDPRGISEADGAVWADADTDQAARLLTALADAPERRAVLGDAAQRAAHARFNGDGLSEALAAIGYRMPAPG